MKNIFNVGDKIMGIHSMYHDEDKPFYGEIRDVKPIVVLIIMK